MFFKKFFKNYNNKIDLKKHYSKGFIVSDKERIKNCRIYDAFQICYDYLKSIEVNLNFRRSPYREYRKIVQFNEPHSIVYDYNDYSPLGANNGPMIIPARIDISFQEDGNDVLIEVTMKRHRFSNYSNFEWFDINKTKLSDARSYWVDVIVNIYDNVGVDMSERLYERLYPISELTNREKRIELMYKRVKDDALELVKIFMGFFTFAFIIIFIFDNEADFDLFLIGLIISLLFYLPMQYVGNYEIKKEKNYVERVKEKLHYKAIV